MAEDTDTDIEPDEAAELEKLLDEADADEALKKFSIKKLFNKLLANKKLLWIGGGALLLLLVGAGVGAYFLLTGEKAEEVLEEVQSEVEETVEEDTGKVYIYKLDTFFLPFRVDGKESGKFLSVTPNLLLSNAALDREIDKVLPLVRKNIYTILKRKSIKDFTVNKVKSEERLKKEILTTANALLLSGTGTVTDVFLTQFLVK